MGRQMETVKVKWRVLETMGRQITMPLPQHLNEPSTPDCSVHLQLKGGIKFKLVDIAIIIYYGLK